MDRSSIIIKFPPPLPLPLSPCPSSSSSRWCPTPEQVMILEQLYKRGVRNPNASQIQKITQHLSLYGKIQGKSVFYWFQNHKARDRQKLRKKIAKQQQHQQHLLLLYQTTTSVPAAPDKYSSAPIYFYSPQGFHPHPPIWRDDPQNDCCRMRSYGHDFAIVTEMGPTSCCINEKRPIQTLELFPLKSHTDSS